jgi:bla regulator protein blaR1
VESWVESGVESWLAARLLTGALHGAFVIAVVWLVCRRFPAIPAPVQAGLWWLASLKLLLVFLPLPAVALPLLPAILAPEPGSLPALTETAATLTAVPPSAALGTSLWLSIVVALWASGLLVQAVRLLFAFRRVHGLVGRATPLPPNDGAIAVDLARAVGLRRCPDVRLSAEIAGPLVSGIVRPVVLLPETLPRADWSVAICHELVHVRRHDLVLGWVPALAERLFFFHPFARLAAREYVTAREAACDAGVLRVLGVSAGDYGRLLVSLGVAHAGPLPAAGGAPTSMASLRRRLNMLQHLTPQGRSRHLSWLLAAALALTLVPFELSARQVPVPAPVATPTPIAAPAPMAAPASPATGRPVAPATVVPAALALSPAPATQAAQPRPVARATPQAVTREERRAGSVTPEHRAILEAMKAAEEQIRRQEAASSDEYRKVVEDFNALAEQANRLARASEDEIRRRRETTESWLRQQRDELAVQIEQLRLEQRELTQQLRILAEQQKELNEQQKRLNETSVQLFRETERIGNAVSPRK